MNKIKHKYQNNFKIAEKNITKAIITTKNVTLFGTSFTAPVSLIIYETVCKICRELRYNRFDLSAVDNSICLVITLITIAMF